MPFRKILNIYVNQINTMKVIFSLEYYQSSQAGNIQISDPSQIESTI